MQHTVTLKLCKIYAEQTTFWGFDMISKYFYKITTVNFWYKTNLIVWSRREDNIKTDLREVGLGE